MDTVLVLAPALAVFMVAKIGNLSAPADAAMLLRWNLPLSLLVEWENRFEGTDTERARYWARVGWLYQGSTLA